MAVRTRKSSSKAFLPRTHFTSSPPANSQLRHRSTPRHRLSHPNDQDPESPIGTFAATTARPSNRFTGKENVVPSTRPSRPAAVNATKRHRSHLQRVQFQQRPAPSAADHWPTNDTKKVSEDSSGNSVHISLFPTAPRSAGNIAVTTSISAKILVDETVFVEENEPGLLELLSQSARSRSFPTTAHTFGERVAAKRPRLELQIDYPQSCYTAVQAQSIAQHLATPCARSGNDAAGARDWTAITPELIRDRCTAAVRATRTGRAAVLSSTTQLVQYAVNPPSPVRVCADIGLTYRRTASSHVPDFSHNSPLTDLSSDGAGPTSLFIHRPRYAGYTKGDNNARPRFDIQHVFEPAPATDSPQQVVKLIVPFRGTPFLSADVVSPAEFVHLNLVDDREIHAAVSPSRPTPMIWMQSNAQTFILALEQLIRSAEDHSRFGPILYYTTSPLSTPSLTDTSSRSEEPAYVALYVHLNQIREVRALLATINVDPEGSARHQPHRSVTPFADPYLALLVLSISGHPLYLI